MSADPDLIRARALLLEQRIDPLWKTADRCGAYAPRDEEESRLDCVIARGRVYRFLAHHLGLPGLTDVGALDLEQCRAAWRALAGVTYPDIREWATKRPAAPKRRKAA